MFYLSKSLFTLASCADFFKHIKVLLITAKALNVMTPSFITTQVIKLQKREKSNTGEQRKSSKEASALFYRRFFLLFPTSQ